ncbi:hypothetical protein RF11_01814 [Thelohanellus kitauei]|uniref:Uncharacterized protein n=1 Tax=Thelohanellus kitauei TaxID=669202 RepID=A0A0C2ND03_THEKT|nr:hypothetical protein RF11_01814 [Thelohanellus kitauei]
MHKRRYYLKKYSDGFEQATFSTVKIDVRTEFFLTRIAELVFPEISQPTASHITSNTSPLQILECRASDLDYFGLLASFSFFSREVVIFFIYEVLLSSILMDYHPYARLFSSKYVKTNINTDILDASLIVDRIVIIDTPIPDPIAYPQSCRSLEEDTVYNVFLSLQWFCRCVKIKDAESANNHVNKDSFSQFCCLISQGEFFCPFRQTISEYYQLKRFSLFRHAHYSFYEFLLPIQLFWIHDHGSAIDRILKTHESLLVSTDLFRIDHNFPQSRNMKKSVKNASLACQSGMLIPKSNCTELQFTQDMIDGEVELHQDR